MGLINITDHTEKCYSNEDGELIHDILLSKLQNNEQVILSFKGINSATSSFINSALIQLLEDFSFDFIKKHLRFENTSGQINEIIKQRFEFEVKKRKELINV